jgi:hypothetical protein
MAYLPAEVAEGVFRGLGNLLDAPENRLAFRQMLGLEAHTPFECIGQIDEVRLAFELCRRKGVRGAAMEVFEREVPPVDVSLTLARYLEINEALARECLPGSMRESVLAQMRAAAAHARETLVRGGAHSG